MIFTDQESITMSLISFPCHAEDYGALRESVPANFSYDLWRRDYGGPLDGCCIAPSVWSMDAEKPTHLIVRLNYPTCFPSDSDEDIRRHITALAQHRTAGQKRDRSRETSTSASRPLAVLLAQGVGGRRVVPGKCVVTVLALNPREFLHSVTASARYAQQICVRRTRLMVRMAYYQTLGGGWASVMNVPKALECAFRLYQIAWELEDAPTLRRCRLFVGYAHLWNGNFALARKIFLTELERATQQGDDGDVKRAQAALAQLANPELQDRGDVNLGMTEVWNRMVKYDA